MKILEELVKITTKHPIITILAVLIITGFALVPASKFVIDTNVENWSSKDDPEIAAMNDIKEKFGSQDMATVVVDCSNSNSAAAESYVETLAEKLKENNNWKDIQYKRNLDFSYEKAILYLPEEQLEAIASPDMTLEKFQSHYFPMFKKSSSSEYIASANRKIYLINIGTDIDIKNPEQRNQLFDGLNELIDETKKTNKDYFALDVGFTGGMIVLDYDGDKMTMDDFFITAIVTVILILILLFVFFRSISIPLLSAVPLLVGVIWTSGIIFLLYDSLNVMSVMFAVLLLGLGIDYCVHLLSRFMDEMDDHNNIVISFKHTFAHTGKAVILGCLTTATALFALCFAETTLLHQLGVVVGLGLLLTLAAVFLMMPAIITLCLKFGKINRRRAKFNVLKIVGSSAEKFSSIVIILFVSLLVLFGFSARNAELSSDMYELFPTNTEVYRQLEKVKKNFDYNPDYLISFANSAAELAYSVEGFQNTSKVLRVESILDYFPENQTKKLNIIKQVIEIHPEFADISQINVEKMTLCDLPSEITQHWISDKGEFLIKIIPDGNLYDREYQKKLLFRLRLINSNVSSDAAVWTRIIDIMANDIIRSSLAVLVVLFLIVYIGIRRRNPIFAILSLVPVGFGIIGLLGSYRFFGANLNFISIAMIPLIIGIGIDDGIHIIHRYLEEKRKSISQVVQFTGKAIFLTTATTCLAFSSFLFSSHPSMRFLALVPIIGLIICFLGSVIFLPALIKVFADRKKSDKDLFAFEKKKRLKDSKISLIFQAVIFLLALIKVFADRKKSGGNTFISKIKKIIKSRR